MEANLRAGAAVYNAGEYHAAHDAWEAEWLDLPSGSDDERFLHGLIQFTAAVHHGYGGNWEGARGLAGSGAGYLDGLPPSYRGVNVEEIHTYLCGVAADPEAVERRCPPSLAVGGEAVTFVDLDAEATLVAAEVLADATAVDEGTIETGVEFAREDLAAGEESSPFLALLFDFVREPDRRGLVEARLSQHVSLREARERDVEGLFD